MGVTPGKLLRGRQKGFSLIELSVIISVAAAAVVGFLSWTQPVNITDAKKAIETREKIQRIAKAIEAFRTEKGRIPCPADQLMRSDNSYVGADLYDNKFGLEDLDTTETLVNGVTTLGVDCPAGEGAVPVYSLGLPKDFITDAWGRRFTYHISANLCGADAGTDAAGADLSSDASRTKGCTSHDYQEGVGNLVVSNGASNLTLTGSYILISHGANGYGAYLPSGTKMSASSDTNELENTDGDTSFVQKNKSATFDDITLFKTKVQVERLTDNTTVRQISVLDCEANSQKIKNHTLDTSIKLEDNLTAYARSSSYNDGEQVALSIMLAYQTICVDYYGSESATIRGDTWSGAQCPGNDDPDGNGSTYNAETNTCTCQTGLWNGSCTAMSSPFLVVPHTGTPYITTYNVADWSKVANPTNLPGSDANAADFSPDGSLLVITKTGATALKIYQTSNWADGAVPASDPAGDGIDATFSPDGMLLAVVHATTPYLTVYNTSGWTPVASPPAALADIGRGAAFSPDGKLLAVVHDGGNHLTIYNTTTWLALATPYAPLTAALPAGNGLSVAFSPDGTLLAVGHSTAPYLAVYDTKTWELRPALATPPAGAVNGLDFSPGGTTLALAHAVSPYVSLYNTSNWVKLANPTGGLPAATGEGVSFSPDGTVLAVTNSGSSPFLNLYNASSWVRMSNPAVPPGGASRRIGWAPLK